MVLGVSTNNLKSHDRFLNKFSLPFPLLVDDSKKIVQDYGVWGEKKFMGRKFLGTHRVTFLIDPNGIIKKIWPEVKPSKQGAEVREALPPSRRI